MTTASALLDSLESILDEQSGVALLTLVLGAKTSSIVESVGASNILGAVKRLWVSVGASLSDRGLT